MDEKFKNLIIFGVYGTDEDIQNGGCFAIILLIIGAIIYGIYKFFS